jgi:hypothetical protein
MTQSDPQTPPEADLPPDAARIIAKARRSFGVSIAILLFGFIAIVGALVYRAYRDDGAPVSRYPLEVVALPAGAELVSASTAEGLITLAYRLGQTSQVRIVDGKTGEVVGQFEVGSE